MYQIHLKREEFFSSNKKEGEITINEILDNLPNKENFTLTNELKYQTPFGKNISKKGITALLWEPEGEAIEVYFTFIKGTLSVQYMPETLEILKALSSKLNGYIFGDIGEEY
jgi:hypothetical protein